MARSGEEILNSLFTNAVTLELVPNFFERGRIGILFAVLAAEFVGWEVTLDNYKKEGFLQTAKLSDDILKLSEPFHYQTPALPSKGVAKFYWDTLYNEKTDTIIPFGQIVETADTTPIQYMTIERAVLYSDAEAVYVKIQSVDTGLNTILSANYLTVLSPQIDGVKVINPEETYGAADEEDPLTVRTKALGARYAFEKGTSNSIDLELSRMGIESCQYSLVDNAYGYGSFALYLNTSVQEFIDEVKDRIDEIKACGVYSTYESAISFDFDFDFDVKVVNQGDITPEERDNLIQDVSAEVKNFVITNGIGNNVIISQLIHYLLDALMDTYNIFDLKIDTSNADSNRIDDYGNIIVDYNEKMNITNINVTITTA